MIKIYSYTSSYSYYYYYPIPIYYPYPEHKSRDFKFDVNHLLEVIKPSNLSVFNV